MHLGLEEIALQIALGTALIPAKSPTDPQVEHAYDKARELCRQMGDSAQLFPALHGLRRYYNYRGNHKEARPLAEHLLTLAEHDEGRDNLPWVLLALGETLWYCGEPVEAKKCMEQSLATYDPQQHGALALIYNAYPTVGSFGYQALISWYLGFPDQALQHASKALTLARSLQHPFSVVFLHFYSLLLSQLLGNPPQTQAHAETTLTLTTEHGFMLVQPLCTILKGWALVMQSNEKGIEQMHQGLDTHKAIGAAIGRTWALALLDEAYGIVGQPEEGLEVLDGALGLVHETGERVYEAEIYRLKGQLTLQQEARGWRLETGPSSPQASSLKPQVSRTVEREAEGYFRKAIDIAHRQRAKSLELRATVSLARLWQQQGQKAQARRMLAKIYDWFTEGFDTVDLREAKALLEELKGRR